MRALLLTLVSVVVSSAVARVAYRNYAEVAPDEYRSRLVEFFRDNLVLRDARARTL